MNQPRTLGNRFRGAFGYGAQKTSNAYRYAAPKVVAAGQGLLRRFRNMGASQNARTLGFLLTLANVQGLRNNMRYSDLRAIANRHLAAKTGRPLIFTDGATTVIRRVANTLPTNQRVLKKLYGVVNSAANIATIESMGKPSQANLERALKASVFASRANSANTAGTAAMNAGRALEVSANGAVGGNTSRETQVNAFAARAASANGATMNAVQPRAPAPNLQAFSRALVNSNSKLRNLLKAKQEAAQLRLERRIRSQGLYTNKLN